MKRYIIVDAGLREFTDDRMAETPAEACRACDEEHEAGTRFDYVEHPPEKAYGFRPYGTRYDVYEAPGQSVDRCHLHRDICTVEFIASVAEKVAVVERIEMGPAHD